MRLIRENNGKKMNNSYRVTIKVRNANLLRAIENSGNKVGVKFCEKVGISYITLNDLINLQKKPVYKNGDWLDDVIKLCVFLNVMPCKLFDQDQMDMGLNKNSSSFDSNLAEIKSLSMDENKLQIKVDEVLSKLTPQEEDVVKKRFGLHSEEKTKSMLAEEMGLSITRITQIEEKALRKLRHPKFSSYLEQFE
jgi:hypothetical protein